MVCGLRSAYTLIELLAVITIIAIVVAVALPGLKAIQATAMQTAARQVTSEMKLARQYAITKHTKVRFAICVAGSDLPDLGTSHVARAYIILAATNDVNNSLVGWIPVQDWKFLPDGVVFSDVNSKYYDPLWGTNNPAALVNNRTVGVASSSGAAWQYFDSATVCTTYVGGTTKYWTNSVVEFLSTGNISADSFGGTVNGGVRLIQGTVLNPATRQILVNNSNNWAYIEYSRYGGRVRSRYADSYNK